MSAKNAYSHHLENWSDIQAHLPRLYDRARGNCMEIGVRSGVSTAAILAGLEDHGGHLYSVDINACLAFEGHAQWSFLRADSIMEADKVKAFIPEKLDLLFVDGDHSLSGALSDLRNYGPRAKRVLVHDIDAPDFPGVRQAVDEFLQETKRRVTYYNGSFGMAEIV